MPYLPNNLPEYITHTEIDRQAIIEYLNGSTSRGTLFYVDYIYPTQFNNRQIVQLDNGIQFFRLKPKKYF